MTQSEANMLFSKYDYATAKSMLLDECHRNGVDVDEVNASIFELMAAACNGAGAMSNHSNTANGALIGGSGTATICNGEPDLGEPAEPGSQSLSPEPSGGEPNTEPSVGEPNNDTADPSEPQSAEPQSNSEPHKRTRNTPSWKKIAEEKEEQMQKMKEEMQRQIDDAKQQSSEPQSAEDMEKKAAELIRKAEAIREEERKRKEEEERKRKEQMKDHKHELTDEVVRRLKCLGIVMLSGPAGSGKSSLAMQACKEMFKIKGDFYDVIKSGKFAQISFSPDTMSADMLGFTDVNGVYHETDIVKVFREGGVMLFDEVDSADPSVFTKLNTMVANGTVPTPNGVVTRHPEAYFVWTGNTWGTGANSMYCGRNRLDAASLDRVTCATIYVDYDTKLERMICANNGCDEAKTKTIIGIATTIRDLIKRNSWKFLCSTRFVINASKMIASGYTMTEVMETFLASWDGHNKKIVMDAIRIHL